MNDILTFLKSLTSVAGVSGHESPVADLIKEKWSPLVDEIELSRVGSIHALKKGFGNGRHPKLMVATHMDTIGLIVSGINSGFIHIEKVGDIDLRVLPGLEVTVHASSGDQLPGVIALRKQTDKIELSLDQFLIDVGLLPSMVEEKVKVGDIVSFASKPIELNGGILSGHSMDNRASVVALTICLEALQERQHIWDVWAVATVQEEINFQGAYSSAFQIQPDIGIVIDATFGRGPGANDWQTHELGQGVGLCLGPNMHPFLHKKLSDIANNLEIPWFVDVAPLSSGTDAFAMQVTMSGIPTGLIEVPIRYMHMPIELVMVKDIQRAGRLLTEFIESLESEFLESVIWE